MLVLSYTIWYMSQETLQYPRIRHVSNPQIICGIIEGFPWNHQRVSAELSKGRVYVDLFKGISAVRIVKGIGGMALMITAESLYCIPRIVEE